MRNYCTAFFTSIHAWEDPPSTVTQTEYAVGLDQESAHGQAVAGWGAVFAGFDHVDYADLGIRYLLLNRETIVGVFTSHLDGGSIAFNAFTALSDAEGLDPGVTPKNKPSKWPSSDGKKTKNTEAPGAVLAPAVFDTITTLQNLANQLLKSPDISRRRVGGIILYQLGLALTGRSSIVDVLRFLEPFLAQVA